MAACGGSSGSRDGSAGDPLKFDGGGDGAAADRTGDGPPGEKPISDASMDAGGGSDSVDGHPTGGGGTDAGASDRGTDLGPAPDGISDPLTDGGADADAGGGTEATTCPASSGDAGGPGPAPDQVTFLASVTVETVAGSGAYASMNGVGTAATFENPVSVIIEPAGSVLIGEYDNNSIRRMAADLTVTTLAKQTNFYQPFGMAYAPNGTLYVATDYDDQGHKSPQSGTIWRLDPVTGVPTMVATGLGRARGFAVLENGRLVFSNYQNHRLYLVTPGQSGTADLAGSGVTGCPGSFADGTGADARFWTPYGMVVLSDGRIIVADRDNHRLRAVTGSGVVTTYAGDGGNGTIDGPRLQARFGGTKALAIDANDNIYVSDDVAHRIRRVAADGTVTTVAGDGTAGWKDGTGAEARFYGQEGLAITADGKTLYAADGTGGGGVPYNRVRAIHLGP